jgi:hypothetical protein
MPLTMNQRRGSCSTFRQVVAHRSVGFMQLTCLLYTQNSLFSARRRICAGLRCQRRALAWPAAARVPIVDLLSTSRGRRRRG